MAKATLIPPAPTKPSIFLELSFEEAQAVLSVLGRVNGSSIESPRKFTSEVYDALSGVIVGGYRLPSEALSGTLIFHSITL